MRRFWRWIKAVLRTDPAAVCEMSRTKGLVDYHDYPDSVEGVPEHFVALTCKRCGKQFMVL
jgi:hypothetical protein